jgi:endonuclease/exonuclease/phosphatase family metal-dependent hydrolase
MLALTVAATLPVAACLFGDAAWADGLVPIRGAGSQSGDAGGSPGLVPIGAIPAVQPTGGGAGLAPIAGASAAAIGLPPLRPISIAPLPQQSLPPHIAAARHDMVGPVAAPPLTIRSIPIAGEPPQRTAGMAALGLSPIHAPPIGSQPAASQATLAAPPRGVHPAPEPVAMASLPAPRPQPVSYAPLPIAPQPTMLPPAASSAPMLPPPLPVAVLPPPLPALPPPLPVPAADPLPPLPVGQTPAPAPAIPAATSIAMPQPGAVPALQSAPVVPPLPPQLPPTPVAAAAPPPGGKPADAVMIASFNIQVFGESKLAKPHVVDVLTKVVRQFDIVAVQEVRAKSDSVVPTFVSAINADGSRYQYVIGPRLGRTVSKEQYTFIYDTNRIELDPASVDTLPNPGGKFHRPPLRARFRVRTNPPEAGFSFWLVDIHTDPDEVPQEVDALADAFVSMRSLRPDEDDVIVLGDLNAGPPQFGRIKQIPGIGWAVSGVTTNTRRTKTYDNLIFDRTVTTEYTGRWGVLDLQDTFRIPLDKALEVSDHNPVWAAFSPWEARQMAGQSAPPR